MQENAEVVVIGGGPAGACAAATLAGLGLSAILFETRPRALRKPGETLAAPAGTILDKLGVWDEFVAAGHLPCHGNVSAWGHDRWQENDFMFHGLGSAWQLDRAVFEESLIRAASRAGARIIRGQEVTEIARENDGWRLSVGGKKLGTGYIVDATGRRSMMARREGVKRVAVDRMVAIHGLVAGGDATDRDGRTFIESCPEGWWYSALVPGRKRIVSLQTDADLLPRDFWKKREWFIQRLECTQGLSSLLQRHGYELNGTPKLTSAHSGRLERFSGEGWVAVGDAAMSFDPLCGQGIVKAMQSGANASQTVSRVHSERRPKLDRWYHQLWKEFLEDRKACYSMEQRWRHAPFWQRRLAAP